MKKYLAVLALVTAFGVQADEGVWIPAHYDKDNNWIETVDTRRVETEAEKDIERARYAAIRRVQAHCNAFGVSIKRLYDARIGIHATLDPQAVEKYLPTIDGWVSHPDHGELTRELALQAVASTYEDTRTPGSVFIHASTLCRDGKSSF